MVWNTYNGRSAQAKVFFVGGGLDYIWAPDGGSNTRSFNKNIERIEVCSLWNGSYEWCGRP